MNKKQIEKEIKKLESDYTIMTDHLYNKKELISQIQNMEKAFGSEFSKWDKINIVKIGCKYIIGNDCRPEGYE